MVGTSLRSSSENLLLTIPPTPYPFLSFKLLHLCPHFSHFLVLYCVISILMYYPVFLSLPLSISLPPPCHHHFLGYLIWRSTIIPHPGLSGSHLTHFSGELLLGIDGKAAKDLSVATVLFFAPFFSSSVSQHMLMMKLGKRCKSSNH